MAVEEKNRRIIAAVRKFAPAVLAALWAAPFVHHGSTKRVVPPAPATNAVLAAGVASDAAASPEPATTTADGRFRVAARPAANGLARPDGVALFDRWSRRGVADDAFRLAPPGWWLRLPGGFADGVTVFSRGEIRPNARTPCFPPVACGPVALPPSLELAVGETYSAEFLCEAGAESAAASDVEVVGEFIENETGRTFTSRAALTVVRVELQAKKTAPENGCRGRHVYGVNEIVKCI